MLLQHKKQSAVILLLLAAVVQLVVADANWQQMQLLGRQQVVTVTAASDPVHAAF